jgi:hypothetical protein
VSKPFTVKYQQVAAQPEQQDGHDGLREVDRQVHQHRGADERPHRPGHGDGAHHPPVDVAERVVGDARGRGGAELGELHHRRGQRRVGAEHQQQRGGGDAVRHAEAAVDELGGDADEGEHDELLHGGTSEVLRSMSPNYSMSLAFTSSMGGVGFRVVPRELGGRVAHLVAFATPTT